MDPHRLRHQASHLLKYWVGLIGGIKTLGPQSLSDDQASRHQLPEFALNCTQRNVRPSSKLAQVERFAYMTVEDSKQGSARAPEECVGEDARCTHFGVNRTRKGYEGYGLSSKNLMQAWLGTWKALPEDLMLIAHSVSSLELERENIAV